MSALQRFLYHRETCKNFQSLLADCDCGADEAAAELAAMREALEAAKEAIEYATTWPHDSRGGHYLTEALAKIEAVLK